MPHRHPHHNQRHQERENQRQEMLKRLDALEKQTTLFGTKFTELDNQLSIVDNKLAQLPIISEVLQNYAKSIAEGSEQDKKLKDEVHKLSNRLDSYDLLSKFVCSSSDPADLQGKAKEMYGLICPTEGRDEL